MTLLTDFGWSDAYAGVMKGVLLSRAPGARIVDLTHDVVPQAVESGAFLLETAWRFFPPGTVHVAVVDPGVGSGRRRLALLVQGQYFVGPDNGVLSAALPDSVRGARRAGEAYRPRDVSLPSEVAAVSIENESLFLRPASATFEGRDVFAPAAAHLARGGGLSELGPAVGACRAFAAFRAPRDGEGLDGLVVHVDRFGNLITDLRVEDVEVTAVIAVAGRRLGLTPAYAAMTGVSAINGSSGFVEIAAPNGSAAIVLGAEVGDAVRVVSK